MIQCYLGPGRLVVLERWLHYRVTILDRFYSMIKRNVLYLQDNLKSFNHCQLQWVKDILIQGSSTVTK